jgi:hypothetical protein
MYCAICRKSQDVIGVLEDIAEESIQLTKFFHGGSKPGEEGYETLVPFPLS